MGVLGPGRCLDGFGAHFSYRLTRSEPKISILDPESIKFRKKSPKWVSGAPFWGALGSLLAPNDHPETVQEGPGERQEF